MVVMSSAERGSLNGAVINWSQCSQPASWTMLLIDQSVGLVRDVHPTIGLREQVAVCPLCVLCVLFVLELMGDYLTLLHRYRTGQTHTNTYFDRLRQQPASVKWFICSVVYNSVWIIDGGCRCSVVQRQVVWVRAQRSHFKTGHFNDADIQAADCMLGRCWAVCSAYGASHRELRLIGGATEDWVDDAELQTQSDGAG